MRRAAVLLTLFLLAASAPQNARADGDPASDVLASDTVFLPYAAPSAQVAEDLRSVVDAARTAGQPVRVAVIQSRQDLGAVASLFGFPVEYARLLSQELGNPVEPGVQGRTEPLLIVMPGGYGVIGFPGRAEQELRKIELGEGASSDDLARAAGYGVQVLASTNGKRIKRVFDKPTEAAGGGALLPLLIVLGLVALVGVLIVVRTRMASGGNPPEATA